MATETVESPISQPSAVGGSKDSHAPATAPAGTRISHGTAGSALVAAAEKALADEGAASSAAQATGAQPKSGDTPPAVAPTGGAVSAPEPKPGDGQPAAGGAAGARDPQLESRFISVARNAQAKVLETLGLRGVSYEQLPQIAQEMRTAFALLRDLRKDPKDFHTRLAAELGAGDGTAETFKLPEGRLTAEDGKTRVFSTDQIANEIIPALEKEITRKLLSNGALSKVISYVDGETERRQSETAENQRRESLASVLKEARELPHFKESEQDIVALISAWNHARPDVLQARGVAWAVHAAYNQVLNQKVYGKTYRETVEASIREEMRKKANGSSVPVGDVGRTDGTKPELRNTTDLAEHMRRMEAAG